MDNGLPQYFKNLSPSKVNAFLEWRSKWFLSDILKRRLPGSPNMERGKAVENGITSFLIGTLPLEDAKAYAMTLYADGTKDLDIDDATESGKPIPELVEAGIKALQPYGKVIGSQRRVGGNMDGTILDWIGYTDLEFEGNIVVDIKVTGKIPPSMSHGHSRQGAFYQRFVPDCKRVDFLYLIPLKGGVKSVIHTVTDVEKHIHDLRQGAMAMHKMLSVSDDPKDLIPLFHPAPGDWWLKDPMAMNLATEVWNISDFTPAQEIAA